MKEDFTWHGGRLETARAHFGDLQEPWIDLSTGINPNPWPHTEISCPADWAALPSAALLQRLEEKAARFFGVDPAHICALPGSEIGLRLLPLVLPLPGLHMSPTYRTHSAIFPDSISPEVGLLSTAAPQAVLMANPNNPDGKSRSVDEMRGWLGLLEQDESWLIIDEAFADADPRISLAAQIADKRRLVIFRSFGKFFGLAGVRLGFVLGPPAILQRYRHMLGDWPVHAAALTIGTAAYADEKWIEQTRRLLRANASRLDDLLRKHGLEPIGRCPLFRLVETGEARKLFERLAQRAILTRPFDYAPDWLRIGLPGDEAAHQRLDEALADG